jgi:hypothetical protein
MHFTSCVVGCYESNLWLIDECNYVVDCFPFKGRLNAGANETSMYFLDFFVHEAALMIVQLRCKSK